MHAFTYTLLFHVQDLTSLYVDYIVSEVRRIGVFTTWTFHKDNFLELVFPSLIAEDVTEFSVFVKQLRPTLPTIITVHIGFASFSNGSPHFQQTVAVLEFKCPFLHLTVCPSLYIFLNNRVSIVLLALSRLPQLMLSLPSIFRIYLNCKLL